MRPRVPRLRSGHWSHLGVLLLMAFCLRPSLSSLPPVLETIRSDTGLDHRALGLLTALPVVCMGILTVPSIWLARRIGAHTAIFVGAGLLTLATAGRAGGGTYPLTLYAAMFTAGAGITLMQSLLPGLVKERYGRQAVLVTGAYATMMTLGAAAGASFTVPLATTLGGSWPLALSAWSLPALLATLAWRRRDPAGQPAVPALSYDQPGGTPRDMPACHEAAVWRTWRGWAVTLTFGIQSFIFMSVLTWLSPMYEDRGWTNAQAGGLLAVFMVIQIPAGMVVAWTTSRFRNLTTMLTCMLALTAIGLAGLVWLPGPAHWTWVTMLAVGLGALLPLALALPIEVSGNRSETNRLIAMTFTIGYLVSSAGPFVTGVLRDGTGSHGAGFALLCLLSLGVIGIVRTLPQMRSR